MAFGDLYCKMSALLATCKNQISRAKKKLCSQRRRTSPTTKLRLTKPSKAAAAGKGAAKRGGDNKRSRKKGKEEEVVWRRTILMGEKCRPLDFPGVIYYDSEGKQLPEVPTPRTPMTAGDSPFSSALQLNSVEASER